MLKKFGRTTKINQDREGLEVPPGQYVTEKFPVLTYGSIPKIDMDTWQFKIFGLVEEEVILDWQQFNDVGKVAIDAEFHCVTQWSNLHNTWEGISFNDLAQLVKPKPEAKFVMIHCYGGYTTNLPLEVVADDDVLFAYKHDGEPLTANHGAPLRFIVPKRYGWKSAKWANGIEFMDKNVPGFWETRGYHMDGDPWKEERFWDELG